MSKFRLQESFIRRYKSLTPPWGFGVLSELVYYRTYSRIKSDGSNERWWETVRRVVEGCYEMQRQWIANHKLGWNEDRAQKSAREMYDRMFNMKFLPPGRGLWAMGSPIVEERGLYAALNNCAFVSTRDDSDPSRPYRFLMDMSMLGVGVGFDTKGSGLKVCQPLGPLRVMSIPDSREGWVWSVGVLLAAYLNHGPNPDFDYNYIRVEGLPIKGFGGVSSGPGPLVVLHRRLRNLLDSYVGKKTDARFVVDVMNMIGACVVAGNVRRTAEISLGDYIDNQFLDLKNYQLNPERMEYGWTSNNSIYANMGMNYSEVAKRTNINGEPGYFWLKNARDYGRMGREPDYKDAQAVGTNPCSEQTLESYELCCLVETFPHKHESLEDFKETLKYAYLYAKTVTLGPTHWEETNNVMARNRRIGCSMTGVAQFIASRSISELRHWCNQGYNEVQRLDKKYSDWLCVPRSIKTTSVKPSGTVSLLAGATPGVHYPESRFYIRRMRLSIHSPMVAPLVEAGYKVEPCVGSEDSTVVVEIPVAVKEDIRTVAEVSMWEQLELTAFMQEHWADNQVSVTVTFDPEKEGHQIEKALDYHQFRLKSVSFLPRIDYGAFPQMPYEAISEDDYHRIASGLKKVSLHISGEEATPEVYCDSDGCVVL